MTFVKEKVFFWGESHEIFFIMIIIHDSNSSISIVTRITALVQDSQVCILAVIPYDAESII